MKIQILCDNINSWIIPYIQKFIAEMELEHVNIGLHFDHSNVEQGDILFLLSCEKKFKNLSLNMHTLVVHESALPSGKGWSPLTWQILEGKNLIPITLFQAQESIDSGDIYEQILMEFNGSELIDELRDVQAEATFKLLRLFIQKFPNNKNVPQKGEESFYKKRIPSDSELDINKSILEQFNLMRVCDNERYPSFFQLNGHKYKVKIYKES